MIPTPHTSVPATPPRNCVRVVKIDEVRVMVMSITASGEVLERYEGPKWLVTDLKLQIMQENLSKSPPAETVLKLVTDD